MRAILTVVGKDRVGIIAAVSTKLAEYNINVLDISQTVIDGFFNMIMITDISGTTLPLAEVATGMDGLGKEMGLSVRIQREDIFDAMHRI